MTKYNLEDFEKWVNRSWVYYAQFGADWITKFQKNHGNDTHGNQLKAWIQEVNNRERERESKMRRERITCETAMSVGITLKCQKITFILTRLLEKEFIVLRASIISLINKLNENYIIRNKEVMLW
jgi:hypothetical protein